MRAPGHEIELPPPAISVIIPTFNRRRRLEDLLATLAGQALPAAEFEVIVVDDGSTDDTGRAAGGSYPFRLRYHQQDNAGDAAARNTGAALSSADWLVFLDDDILVHPDFLKALLPDRAEAKNRIVVGTEILWLDDSNPLETQAAPPEPPDGGPDLMPIPFAEVCSNNMAIRRVDFQAVGPMEALDFRGSSIWCDVEFSYRAFRRGFDFMRRPDAFCWHRDYVSADLENRKKRMKEAGYRAVRLFRRHPGLSGFLPMFEDKTPVELQRDGTRLLVRKILRRMSAARPVLAALEALEAGAEWESLRKPLRRWIIGAYIYRGYHLGLKELPPTDALPERRPSV
jgi:glycosyltransferase involved in cell wall biosynthesis